MTQKGGQKYNISFCKGWLRNFRVSSNFFRKPLSLNRVLLMESFFLSKELQLLYLVSRHLWTLHQGNY